MENQKSGFNVAVSHLVTINTLQAMAAEAAISMDINSWRHILAAIFRRVSPYINETEFKEMDAELKRIMSNVNSITNMMSKKGLINIPPDIYNSMHYFEIKLLRYAKNYGLFSKMEEMEDD